MPDEVPVNEVCNLRERQPVLQTSLVPVPGAKEVSEEEIVIEERPLHFMKNSS